MKNGENQQLLLDLFRAYFDTRKNKRSTVNALAFEVDYEEKLLKLYREIMNRTYAIGKSVCFIVDKPVKREIFAADFRDRIVQHLVYNYINPIFEKHFIKDSYSCRIGKGTSYGIKRANHFIRSVSENYQKECWILKLDVRGYFMAMDRDILYEKIERTILNQRNTSFDTELVLYLIRIIIYNEPTKNFITKGHREDWIGLPKSKSLFFAGEGKGFPIGNLTSQLFSNIYLDEFDHFVHDELGISMYGRYVDDMLLVHNDKEFLKYTILKIKHYLLQNLKITLHPKKIYLQNCQNGVNFLGTYIKPWRIYIGRKTKNNLNVRIGEWKSFIKEKNGLGSNEDVERLLSQINSYLGIMSHYNTHTLRKKIAQSFCVETFKVIAFSKDFKKAERYATSEKMEVSSSKVSIPNNRTYAFLVMFFIWFMIQATFPLVAFATTQYYSSGTVYSTNLLIGKSASAITNFHYNLSSLPGNSSVSVQFSTDNTNWYSASGVLNNSNTLSTIGGADLALTAGWSGTTFYYKLTINSTSDLSATPVIDNIRLDSTANSGYGNMLVVTDSGHLGIGTTTPNSLLTVAGTIQSTALLGGSTNLTTDASGNIIRDPSDVRLKENVTTIENALDTVLGLRGVRYEWIDKERFGSQFEIGFIAQEVDTLVPEVVQKGGEYWSLNSKNLIAVVVEAIKEVWAKILGHEERLNEYQGLIQELKIENTELKTRIETIEEELNIEQTTNIINTTDTNNSSGDTTTELPIVVPEVEVIETLPEEVVVEDEVIETLPEEVVVEAVVPEEVGTEVIEVTPEVVGE